MLMLEHATPPDYCQEVSRTGHSCRHPLQLDDGLGGCVEMCFVHPRKILRAGLSYTLILVRLLPGAGPFPFPEQIDRWRQISQEANVTPVHSL